jgi:hypothetical protein
VSQRLSCTHGRPFNGSPSAILVSPVGALAVSPQRGVGASVGRKGCSRVVHCPPLLATVGWCRRQCARLAVLAELSPFRSDLCCASLAARVIYAVNIEVWWHLNRYWCLTVALSTDLRVQSSSLPCSSAPLLVLFLPPYSCYFWPCAVARPCSSAPCSCYFAPLLGTPARDGFGRVSLPARAVLPPCSC